jgi:hypothetical protein
MIDRAYKDPIVGILLKNSNITVTQYETLIIDYLTNVASDIEISYENKTHFRSKKVSRGSFSRTLSQARGNIISSIEASTEQEISSFLRRIERELLEGIKNLAEPRSLSDL